MKFQQPSYTTSLFSAHRRKTREVRVGGIPIGSNCPIVVQSMTTTPTTDTEATVNQIESLKNVGCEIVRITVPTQADLKNMANIRKEMERRKLEMPLVADVHFLPKIAMEACNYFDKVRVNPGNFADRKHFEVKEYSDNEYESELQRIYDAFGPLVKRAQEKKIAIRIGTNHGSLSDRIMNRYGDTPLGMVESALEFIRIAEGENFRDLVISMKASNPFVMVHAYRLLVSKMNELSMDYPLHLGVTEAGNGRDGRVKSAVGIASLLSDGLGDTIRVSLTEDPEFEIPVARKIIEHFGISPLSELKPPAQKDADVSWNFFQYQRRESGVLTLGDYKLGGHETVRVNTHVDQAGFIPTLQKASEFEPEAESVSFDLKSAKKDLPIQTNVATLLRVSTMTPDSNEMVKSDFYKQISMRPNDTWSEQRFAGKLIELIGHRLLWVRVEKESEIEPAVKMFENLSGKIQIGLEISSRRLIHLARKAVAAFDAKNLHPSILLNWRASDSDQEEDIIVQASNEIGALLNDGIGDVVEISSSNPELNHEIGFTVLQATRLRMSRADYIACPSCGRTLFDLQTTTARIKAQTDHLKGVKIAIMGCIVNGPGEMADADFGYVGSGPGHINLYVGKECVERGISQEVADQRLIQLIKDHGRWTERVL
ncbi:MAG: (E)-4-hydroxy-3-methylbut-2-enyl-diphosphate synthase [Proteobacteria bacterium]|nr:(E)-4-hydroxy-3-methylbut-2-enyl-diphosphate synthase [Pseudomonadota bacterium]